MTAAGRQDDRSAAAAAAAAVAVAAAPEGEGEEEEVMQAIMAGTKTPRLLGSNRGGPVP
jgi:hypothetical protein